MAHPSHRLRDTGSCRSRQTSRPKAQKSRRHQNGHGRYDHQIQQKRINRKFVIHAQHDRKMYQKDTETSTQGLHRSLCQALSIPATRRLHDIRKTSHTQNRTKRKQESRMIQVQRLFQQDQHRCQCQRREHIVCPPQHLCHKLHAKHEHSPIRRTAHANHIPVSDHQSDRHHRAGRLRKTYLSQQLIEAHAQQCDMKS